MIRVLLVDDQILMCKILQDWLGEEEDFEVVGYANNGEKAIELVEELMPNVVIMDVEMPEMDGVSATEIICQRFAKVSVVIFSANDSYDRLALALQVGAKGYILKGGQKEEIVQTIRSIHQGYSQLEPRLLEKIFELSKEGGQIRDYTEEARKMLEDTARIQKTTIDNYHNIETELIAKTNQLQNKLEQLQGESDLVDENFTLIKEKFTHNAAELQQLRKYTIAAVITASLAIIISIFF